MNGMVMDRACGAMLGVHLGDSIGSTWEFMGADQLRDEPCVGQLIGGGPFRWNPGDATDDTQQTVAVAQAFLDAHDMGAHQIETWTGMAQQSLIQWYLSNPPDVGSTTGASLNARANDYLPPLSVHRSTANGAMMRAVPCALVTTHPRARRQLARDVAAITHPAQVVQDLVELYVEAVAVLCCGGRSTDDWRAVHDRIRGYLPALVDDSHPDDWDVDGLFTMGSSFTALRMGMWALQRSDDVGPWEALREVVRAGGDTDTNAAIAGGLLGAAWGAWYWIGREPGPLQLGVLQYGQRVQDLAQQLVLRQPVADRRLRAWTTK